MLKIATRIDVLLRAFKMAPMLTAIEQVLEASFDILGKDADKKIDYFEQRIKAINGYW